MIGTKLYKGQFTDEQYANEAIWANNNKAKIIDKGEYYETCEYSVEEKMAKVRAVRQSYYEEYVDFYQSKPLLWEELEVAMKEKIIGYREYLKDYTKQEGWYNQNPKTFEEWCK